MVLGLSEQDRGKEVGTLFTEAKSCIDLRMIIDEIISVGLRDDWFKRCLMLSINFPVSSVIERGKVIP